MSVRAFFDTSVLVYADDASTQPKQAIAQALLEAAFADATGVISTQVLMEYYAVATQRLHIDAQTALRRTADYAHLQVVQTDSELVLQALALHQRVHLSHWDALIVRAAAVSGCKVLYTEDMQAETTLDGVRVVNPFS